MGAVLMLRQRFSRVSCTPLLHHYYLVTPSASVLLLRSKTQQRLSQTLHSAQHSTARHVTAHTAFHSGPAALCTVQTSMDV